MWTDDSKYMYSAVSHFTSLHSHLCRFKASGCSWNQSSPLRTFYSRFQRKGGSSSRWTRTWRTLWGIHFVTPKSCQPPPYQACLRSCKAQCWNAYWRGWMPTWRRRDSTSQGYSSSSMMNLILPETKDPTRVRPHLKKYFEGISKLVHATIFSHKPDVITFCLNHWCGVLCCVFVSAKIN